MTQKIEHSDNQGLRKGVLFSLFATSYTPLFILIILRQISQNLLSFDWNQHGSELVTSFALHFGLSAILLLVIVSGLGGMMISLRNIRGRAASNARVVKIVDATNRSGEAISYIGTYILPFVFEDYNDLFGTFAVAFLLFVIYRIYINSSLLLINPLLNMSYALYDISFSDGDGIRAGMLITRNQQLENGEEVKIYGLGKKLYFGVYP